MLEQKWYTVADVAALTGLTSRTIRNYLKDGTLHGKKIGVQWRFTEDDINGLFQEVDFGQKLQEIEDNLVADFLKETARDEESECRILDIPDVTEEEWKRSLKKIRREIDEKKEGMPKFAWEYVVEEKMLRVVIAGKPKDVERMAKRVKRGLKTDAE